MQLQIIMLPNPIIVSKDKEQVQLEKWYYENDNHIPIYQFTKETLPKEYYLQKLIAGIPELPSIDFSALSDEDCKKIGKIFIGNLALNHIVDADMPVHKQINLFTEGFKTAQSLNDKKYDNEDMLVIRNRLVGMIPVGEVNAWDMITAIRDFTKWFDEYVESIHKPKVFDIEVEMEYVCRYPNCSCTLSCEKINYNKRPKITNNSIKINKIL